MEKEWIRLVRHLAVNHRLRSFAAQHWGVSSAFDTNLLALTGTSDVRESASSRSLPAPLVCLALDEEISTLPQLVQGMPALRHVTVGLTPMKLFEQWAEEAKQQRAAAAISMPAANVDSDSHFEPFTAFRLVESLALGTSALPASFLQSCRSLRALRLVFERSPQFRSLQESTLLALAQLSSLRYLQLIRCGFRTNLNVPRFLQLVSQLTPLRTIEIGFAAPLEKAQWAHLSVLATMTNLRRVSVFTGADITDVPHWSLFAAMAGSRQWRHLALTISRWEKAHLSALFDYGGRVPDDLLPLLSTLRRLTLIVGHEPLMVESICDRGDCFGWRRVYAEDDGSRPKCQRE